MAFKTAEEMKLLIHSSNIPESASAPASGRRPRLKSALSFQERLLRNCFLASAVLLGILALANVQQPWAIKASTGIERALTMELNLDESLGQLSFVRDLMPESALVFFNLGGTSELAAPVKAELSHAYSAAQPWLMFALKAESEVCAAEAGSVTAVSELSSGGWGVLIDHGAGRETVTAGLQAVQVQMGDTLVRGAKLGTAAGSVYFEYREGGSPVDPTERLGL